MTEKKQKGIGMRTFCAHRRFVGWYLPDSRLIARIITIANTIASRMYTCHRTDGGIVSHGNFRQFARRPDVQRLRRRAKVAHTRRRNTFSVYTVYMYNIHVNVRVVVVVFLRVCRRNESPYTMSGGVRSEWGQTHFVRILIVILRYLSLEISFWLLPINPLSMITWLYKEYNYFMLECMIAALKYIVKLWPMKIGIFVHEVVLFRCIQLYLWIMMYIYV